MHGGSQFSLDLEAMVFLRLPKGAVAALWKFTISVSHVLSTFVKKVGIVHLDSDSEIVVNYDVTFECHTQIVLHVKVVKIREPPFSHHFSLGVFVYE